jgi:hypothetical protein
VQLSIASLTLFPLLPWGDDLSRRYRREVNLPILDGLAAT